MKKSFETAPKDGRHILGWWRRSKNNAANGFAQIYFCQKYKNWSYANSSSFVETLPEKWQRIN